jgi:serralysin
MTVYTVEEGDYVAPPVGSHVFKYEGITAPIGGFLVHFGTLTDAIKVDLVKGTASGGDMSATGLKYARYVSATPGDDILKGSAINLEFATFVGFAGDDKIDGRGGFDWVMYDDEVDYGTGTISTGLSKGFQGVVVNLAKNTAKDSYGDTDTLKNVEGIIGTRFDDKITGDGKANQLRGNEANDKISGGGGKDTIVGGIGRDTLTGGAEKDTFIFGTLADSGIDAATRDLITDFKHLTDKIDVSAIDPNIESFEDLNFKLDSRGGPGTNVKKGHIGWYHVDKNGSANDRTILKFNVDSNKDIEMSIELKGLIDLTKADFIL